ncbi:hypothetical protein [Cohnella terricola]|uniref:Uncharacterized protein n=1 Tax=Cohnella terricola TaxID=1289167 RepID=A0A559JMY7_9BACL|nr:hypothetical protein [Cohnella terricola]TVY01245.1 hypothetical protein FPZ45_08845 [Cohnella terricola]
MGEKRIRKKRRRRRIRKPDTVIVVLASLCVLLTAIWGGLYWKENSERALRAAGTGRTIDSQKMKEAANLPPFSFGATSDPATEELLPTDDSVPRQEEAEKPTSRNLAKPDKANGSGSGAIGRTAPEEADSIDAVETNPIASEEPIPPQSTGISGSQTESTNATDADSPDNATEKYEHEILRVQAMCEEDMDEFVDGAKSSFQRLDKRDPAAMLAWNDKATKEMAAATSDCEGKFDEAIRNAEKDSVIPVIIQEWKQDFISLKEKLQEESKQKLQQLNAG